MISLLFEDEIIEVPVRTQTPLETITLNIEIKRAMNGTPYTYANPQDKIKLTYQLEKLDNIKMFQLIDFFKKIKNSDFVIIDPEVNKKWRGTLISFPIEAIEIGVNNSGINFIFIGVEI